MSISNTELLKHLLQVNFNLRSFLKSEGYDIEDDPLVPETFRVKCDHPRAAIHTDEMGVEHCKDCNKYWD